MSRNVLSIPAITRDLSRDASRVDHITVTPEQYDLLRRGVILALARDGVNEPAQPFILQKHAILTPYFRLEIEFLAPAGYHSLLSLRALIEGLPLGAMMR